MIGWNSIKKKYIYISPENLFPTSVSRALPRETREVLPRFSLFSHPLQTPTKSNPTDIPRPNVPAGRPAKPHDPNPLTENPSRPDPKSLLQSHRHASHSASPRRGPRQRRPHLGLSNPLCPLLLPPTLPQTTSSPTLLLQPSISVSVLLQPHWAPKVFFQVKLVQSWIHRPGQDIFPGECGCETERFSLLYWTG